MTENTTDHDTRQPSSDDPSRSQAETSVPTPAEPGTEQAETPTTPSQSSTAKPDEPSSTPKSKTNQSEASGSAIETHRAEGGDPGQSNAASDTLADDHLPLPNLAAPNAAFDRTEVVASTQSTTMSLNVGQMFGRYRIDKLVGTGAMGAVYDAHDSKLDRQVALKIPLFDGRNDPEAIERFQREARSAAKLHHPNICPIFDVGEIDGVHYLTMGFLKGRLLLEHLEEKKRFSLGEACHIITRLAQGVQQAHAIGIIHRDLKPANVMLSDEGEPIILDFGLARPAQQGPDVLTQTGAVLGTPAYMSPEQVDNERGPVGPHSDVYSLGVILFEMLTGERPYAASNLANLFYQIINDPIPRFDQYRLGIPAELQGICLKAMAKRIADRYPSARELAEDLASFSPPDSPFESRAPQSLAELRQQLYEDRLIPVEEFDRLIDRGKEELSVDDALEILRRSPAPWAEGWEIPQPLLTEFQVDRIKAEGTRPLIFGGYVVRNVILTTRNRGRVYEAFDPTLARLVVLRLVKHDHSTVTYAGANESGNYAGINISISKLAQMHHPGLATLYNVGHAGAVDFVASEFVFGESLATLVEKAKSSGEHLNHRWLLARMADVAEALAYAHEHNVLHHDITPEKIYIGRECTKLVGTGTSFPFSIDVDDRESSDDPSAVLDIHCAAPELWADVPDSSIASDLYAFGCTLYYALTGTTPFSGESDTEMRVQHRGVTPPCVRDQRREVPARVDLLLRKLLAKDPAARPKSARDVAAVLGRYRPSASGSKPLLATIAVGVVALGALGGLGYWLTSMGVFPRRSVQDPTEVVTTKSGEESPAIQTSTGPDAAAIASVPGTVDTTSSAMNPTEEKPAPTTPDPPPSAQALMKQAAAAVKKGEFQSGISLFQQARATNQVPASDVDTSLARANAEWGKQLLAAGDGEKAIAKYTRAIDLDAKSPQYYFQRALAEKKLGSIAAAAKDMKQAVSLAGTNPSAEFVNALVDISTTQAKQLLRANQPDEAIKMIEDVLRTAPASAKANLHEVLANALATQAQTAFSSAASSWTNDDFASAATNYKRAAEIYAEAAKLNPTSEAGYANLAAQSYTFVGAVEDRLGDQQDAVKEYDRALTLDPTYTKAREYRAIAFQKLAIDALDASNDADAVSYFKKAVTDDPKDVKSLNALASILAASTNKSVRDGNQAVKYATAACEATNYKKWEFVLTLADAYAQAGKPNDAKKWAQKSLTLPDANPTIIKAHLEFIDKGNPPP
ncbi:Serine/threonine-protein kinase StkP [Planctomycetes bacterium Pan216]|uniref:non-specific serine/threonine protein kinase n=1 Tax=Kolteria novifilia TaxID=2527975 RepID=A0A518B3P9_9BACT|nr:Serine/threonine-protein kinase StkP [Planctomycetes bacterium Pan216]